MGIDPEVLRAVPKVALHDHLDGGLRASTVLELATEIGHELPVPDADGLADWFFEAADSGSLVRYLETFDHTIAVMQTYPPEAGGTRPVEDQPPTAWPMPKFAGRPSSISRAGLTMARAVEAVRDGLAEGIMACADAGRPIVARQLLTSMRRRRSRRPTWPSLAVAYRNDLPGFDIAGAEDGFRPATAAFPSTCAGTTCSTSTPASSSRVHLGSGASVAPRESATVSGWSRTSPVARGSGCWATSPTTCSTAGSRWRSAPPPTCRPTQPECRTGRVRPRARKVVTSEARSRPTQPECRTGRVRPRATSGPAAPQPWPSIPSACWLSWASG
ncbi:MAG: hypothetical protein KIT69_01995 [Propionibacteriaceae bacterium]|nr:hypothetical protein [Propionibacteriaceae bacterium]